MFAKETLKLLLNPSIQFFIAKIELHYSVIFML